MTYREAKREFERRYLREMLDRHRTVVAAAKAAGMHRAHFYRRMHACGIPVRGNKGSWALQGL